VSTGDAMLIVQHANAYLFFNTSLCAYIHGATVLFDNSNAFKHIRIKNFMINCTDCAVTFSAL